MSAPSSGNKRDLLVSRSEGITAVNLIDSKVLFSSAVQKSKDPAAEAAKKKAELEKRLQVSSTTHSCHYISLVSTCRSMCESRLYMRASSLGPYESLVSRYI